MLRVCLMASALLLFMLPTVGAQPPTAIAPEQVHVTLGEQWGTLVVHWAVVGVAYAPTESPFLQWSTEGGPVTTTPAEHAGVIAPGTGSVTTSRYETHVYSATIGPFEPGTKITYRAGSEPRGFTKQFEVRVPPGPSDPIQFVAYGDIGLDATAADGSPDPTSSEHPAHEIQRLALATDPQLIIIPGDLAYSNTREGWDSFMRFLEPAAATVPVMPVTGNHEWDDALGYAQFLNEFVLPNDEQNFVFRAGPVTFIGVNSDNICGNHKRGSVGSPPRPCNDGQDGTHNLELTAWLESALSEAENDSNPWTIVYHHHPALSYGRHNIDWAVHTYWMPLYAKYGVDLAVTAHDHVYGRSYPTIAREPLMFGSEYPQGLAPVYVVLGGGGRELYQVPGEKGPAWHAHGETVHNFGKFRIDEERLVFEAIRIDGSLMDTFTITRTKQEPSATATAPTVDALFAVCLVVGLLWGFGRRPDA